VYASFYEGWGLPVTESLCYGKACLTVNHSSLPEAGGKFADYYEPESVSSFVSNIERIIFDPEYRAARERQIAEEFRPRSWNALLDGLVGDIVAQFQTLPPKVEPFVAPIQDAVIYRFGVNEALRRPDRNVAVAEMLRYERSWHPIEPWGIFANELSGRLAFSMPKMAYPDGDNLVYLKVRAAREPVTLTVRLGAAILARVPLQPAERQLLQMQIAADTLADLKADEHPVVLHLEVDRLAEDESDGTLRQVGIGLEFFMLCATQDFAARLNVVEHSLLDVIGAAPALRDVVLTH
jgi:hypothetical protein